ncbi:MAG: response regulator [Phycisphaerales bacterium]|nr:response regulator [Phycisphaerales bacterium]MDG1977195.1 response regulator [Phycisphaerales bacterium]MDG2132062.1 response regulator [Phycisphaerales bacterium]
MNADSENRQRRILVADDEEYIVRVVSFKLESAGYEVVEAIDGADAWSKVRAGDIDLVLTDHQMPLMTGLELAGRIAADPATRHIPVIMLTARGFRLDAEEIVASRIVELIAKPFSPRGLLDRIRETLESTERGGERAA